MTALWRKRRVLLFIEPALQYPVDSAKLILNWGMRVVLKYGLQNRSEKEAVEFWILYMYLH